MLAAAGALALALGGLMTFDKIREPLGSRVECRRCCRRRKNCRAASTRRLRIRSARSVAGARASCECRIATSRCRREMRRLRDAESMETALKPQIERIVALAVAVVDASQHTPSGSAEPRRAFDAEVSPFLDSLRATVKDRCAAYAAVHIAWQRAPYDKIDCTAELTRNAKGEGASHPLTRDRR